MAKRGRPPTWTKKRIESLADKLDKWCELHTNFFIGKFAQENGIHRQRLSEFAKKNEYFKEALERAKQHQENVLVEGGLNGEFNPTFAIFTLKNVAGWRDKQETDITSKGKELKQLVVPSEIYERESDTSSKSNRKG